MGFSLKGVLGGAGLGGAIGGGAGAITGGAFGGGGFGGGLTDMLGLTGAANSGRGANAQLYGIGAGLRSQFTPVRIRSLLGDATMDTSGINYSGGLFDTLGGQINTAANRYNAFNQGDVSQNVLNLLRQRTAQQFMPQLSNLQSRLLQQGTLGLGEGAYGANPQMGAFFQEQQKGDLEAQLAAFGESRAQQQDLLAQQQGLMGQYTGLGQFFNQGLFGTEQARGARDIAAANIQAAGPMAELKGATSEQDAKASFWSSIFGSSMKAMSPTTPTTPTK